MHQPRARLDARICARICLESNPGVRMELARFPTPVSGPRMNPLPVHRFRSAAAFAPHRDLWEGLCRRGRCGSFFHTADWLNAAWSYPGKPFLLATVGDAGRWVAGLALCPRFDTGGHLFLPARALTVLPHLTMIYPAVPVAAWDPGSGTEPVDRLLATALGAEPWEVLSFDYQSDDTAWLEQGLRRLAVRRRWQVESVPTSDEAWLDFPDGPEAYWATRSGSLKRKLAKSTRELAARVALSHEDLALSSPDLATCFERFRPAYERSWQQGAGLSPFDPGARAGNLEALQPFFQTGRVVVPVLRAHGEIIAFEFWLREGAEMFGVARGLDPAYAPYSTGSQLTRWTIEESFRRGVTRLYLGPVSDNPRMAYKERWLTGRRSNHRLLVVRLRSPYGCLHASLSRHRRLGALWRRAGLDALARRGFYALRRLKRR